MKTCVTPLVRLCYTALLLVFFPAINHGQAPDLGTTANFILYTNVGAVSNTGISELYGNVGSNQGAITGFDNLNGIVFHEDAVTQQCSTDLVSVYNQLNSTVATIFPAPVLGNGQVLNAGIYSIPQAASLNLGLTLDAQGDPNAVFIFHIQGAYTTNASAKVYLINGALAANVFWKVEGAISMATGTTMRGTLVSNNGAISMGAGDTLEGRALSTTGAVSVYGVVVPVTLIDFSATKVNHGIELNWMTASEYSLASYEVERSADGRNFYNIGSVPATNTHSVMTYRWMDNEPLSPINYYRLRMQDVDHKHKYSPIVKIHRNADKGISVYPNPVTGNTIMLQMYGQSKGVHTITLYNNNAEKLMTCSIIHTGNDAVRSVALDNNLPNGVYYLELSDHGKNRQTLKILVK